MAGSLPAGSTIVSATFEINPLSYAPAGGGTRARPAPGQPGVGRRQLNAGTPGGGHHRADRRRHLVAHLLQREFLDHPGGDFDPRRSARRWCS
ncbi:MAG: hypothetical protein R3E96_08755 [Planctomycetota bacterium]